jgi:hypothetical protein
LTNLDRALRPGGRLVMVVWQTFSQNLWVRDCTVALAAGRDLPAPPPDLAGPFSLADPVRTTSILSVAAFGDISHDGSEEPIYFGATADDT